MTLIKKYSKLSKNHLLTPPIRAKSQLWSAKASQPQSPPEPESNQWTDNLARLRWKLPAETTWTRLTNSKTWATKWEATRVQSSHSSAPRRTVRTKANCWARGFRPRRVPSAKQPCSRVWWTTRRRPKSAWSSGSQLRTSRLARISMTSRAMQVLTMCSSRMLLSLPTLVTWLKTI